MKEFLSNLRDAFAAVCVAAAIMAVGFLTASPASACYQGAYNCDDSTSPPTEQPDTWVSRDGLRLDARGAVASYINARSMTNGDADRQFGTTESVVDEFANYGMRGRAAIADGDGCTADCDANLTEMYVDYDSIATNRAVHVGESDDGKSRSEAHGTIAGGVHGRMEVIRSRLAR